MQSSEFRLRELERKVSRLITVGRVEEVDHENKRALVEVGTRELTWFRLSAVRAGIDRTWNPPSVGEQVMVFAPNGEFVAAVIGQSIYQEAFDAPTTEEKLIQTVLSDGAEFTYDRDDSLLTIKLPGSAKMEVVGDVDIAVDGSLSATVKGNANVDAEGDVKVNGKSIAMNGGSPCVTTAHICHFTGTPHGDGSSTVKAGK